MADNIHRQSEPIFSVVIPVFNKGELVRRTLVSALRQKFYSFEIIVIDDGSTDNSKDIIKEFSDPKISYYYQPKSGLPAAARNSGIKHSKGRYIAFLDADDVWYPGKLDRCYEIFTGSPELDLICHYELMKDISGKVIKTLRYGPYVTDMFRKLLFKGNCLSPSAVVAKKKALLEVGLFREYPEFYSIEDYDLWLRLSKRFKFYFCPEILGEYLLHDRNITSDVERCYNNHIELLKITFKEYEKPKPFDSILINLKIAKINLSLFKHFIFKNNPKKAFSYLLKVFFTSPRTCWLKITGGVYK